MGKGAIAHERWHSLQHHWIGKVVCKGGCVSHDKVDTGVGKDASEGKELRRHVPATVVVREVNFRLWTSTPVVIAKGNCKHHTR